jgi:hypothetical protein
MADIQSLSPGMREAVKPVSMLRDDLLNSTGGGSLSPVISFSWPLLNRQTARSDDSVIPRPARTAIRAATSAITAAITSLISFTFVPPLMSKA